MTSVTRLQATWVASGRPRRGFFTQPITSRRPARLHNLRPAAAASEAAASHERIAALVAEKEAQLANMFEPGKPQPRAAVVAELRKEVAALRSQLQEGLGIDRQPLRPPAANPSTSFPMSASSMLSAAVAGSAGADGNGRVLNALKLVEAQLAVSRQVQTVAIGELSVEEQQELLQLQEENTSLKARLDLIMARQVQLQTLVDQHVASATASSSSNPREQEPANAAVNSPFFTSLPSKAEASAELQTVSAAAV